MDLTQIHDKSNVEAGKKKKKRKGDDDQWKGSEDVEKLCGIFTTYLTSPSNFAKAAGGGDSPATMTNAQKAQEGAAA